MSGRIDVYVAYQPFIGSTPGYSGNIRTQRLVVASHPSVALYPDRWTLLGSVDKRTAAEIAMLDDEATLPKFVARIAPVRVPGMPSAQPPIAGSGLPMGWTEAGIRAAYDDLRTAGSRPCLHSQHKRKFGVPSRAEVACYLGGSESSLDRALVTLGLGTNWPPPGF